MKVSITYKYTISIRVNVTVRRERTFHCVMAKHPAFWTRLRTSRISYTLSSDYFLFHNLYDIVINTIFPRMISKRIFSPCLTFLPLVDLLFQFYPCFSGQIFQQLWKIIINSTKIIFECFKIPHDPWHVYFQGKIFPKARKPRIIPSLIFSQRRPVYNSINKA